MGAGVGSSLGAGSLSHARLLTTPVSKAVMRSPGRSFLVPFLLSAPTLEVLNETVPQCHCDEGFDKALGLASHPGRR